MKLSILIPQGGPGSTFDGHGDVFAGSLKPATHNTKSQSPDGPIEELPQSDSCTTVGNGRYRRWILLSFLPPI